jgi:hypothetical protein
MAWATLFWQNVCHTYELVINADGSSSVTFVSIDIIVRCLFVLISMRQYKLVDEPFASDTIFTGEIGRLKSYEKQKPYVRR